MDRISPYTIAKYTGLLDTDFTRNIDKLAQLPIPGVRSVVMFNADVVHLAGVGQATAKELRANGIATIGDFARSRVNFALALPNARGASLAQLQHSVASLPKA